MSTRRSPCLITVASVLLAASTAVDAEQVSAECRGVAAGVVAAMRAAGELSGDDAVSTAVLAARRACAAAREGLGPATALADGDPAVAQQEASDEEEEEKSAGKQLWDLFTGDRDLKPGNERLRRLKTQ
ncbi:MAG: hypothetical protein RLW61_22970 [Gammaproteobacteria bacterium]